MTAPRTRRRSKLAPDPDVRRTIVAAASRHLREQGVRGLSVAAVLDRAELSTRAFYRHFESKDQLVARGVSGDGAAPRSDGCKGKWRRPPTRSRRLRAWIDGRLDLAFDENIKSDLRRLVAGGAVADVRRSRADSARLRRNAQAADRAAEPWAEERRVPRHRPGDRSPVDPRRGVGEHRTALGRRRLRTQPRSARRRSPVLPAWLGVQDDNHRDIAARDRL